MFWVPNRKTKEQIDREKAMGGKEKVAVRGRIRKEGVKEEFMKVRDSGMPEEGWWSTFFDHEIS